jgi:hypothetical protein
VKCSREAILEKIRLDLIQKSLAYEVVLTIMSLNQEICIKFINLLYAWWEARNKSNAGEGLCSEALDGSPASVIYKEARELINLSFELMNVVHVLRSCNIYMCYELLRLSLG